MPLLTAIMTEHREYVLGWKGPVEDLKAHHVGRWLPMKLMKQLGPFFRDGRRWQPGKVQAYPNLTGLF